MTTRVLPGPGQPRPSLRRVRKDRGWSGNDVAVKLYNLGIEHQVPEHKLGVDARTVSNWELGKREPNETYTALLSLLFGLPPSQLDLPPLVLPVMENIGPVTPDASYDPETLERRQFMERGLALLVPAGVADLNTEPAVDRREFGKAVVGSVLGMPLLDWERAGATLQHGRRADPQLLDQVQRLVSVVTTTATRQLDLGSPDVLAPMLQGSLAFVQSLDHGRQRPHALADAASRLALLYGWVAFQLDNKAESRRIYRFAAQVARDGGLTELHAAILAAASQLDSTIPYCGYDSSNVALVTLDRADALIDGGTSTAVLRAWILARRAQERAALGDTAEAERDFTSARDWFQRGAITPDTFYAYPSEGWIIGFEASCHRLGRRWPEAEAAYARVLAHPSSPLWRSVTMSSLASVQARRREPGQAAETLRQAVELAIEANTPLRLRHIAGARAQLDQFRDMPAVQELDHFLSQIAQV